MSDKTTREAKAAALQALDTARSEREQADRNERAALRDARSAGVSWSRIGEVYGLTKQGAQQRFKAVATAAPTPSDD